MHRNSTHQLASLHSTLVLFVMRKFTKGDRPLAEDIVSEVIIKYTKMGEDYLQSIGNIQASLQKACLNKFIDTLRSQKPTISIEGIEETSIQKANEQFEDVYNIIQIECDETTKTIFTLFLEGYKWTEIEEITGIKLKRIYFLRNQAYILIRALLNKKNS